MYNLSVTTTVSNVPGSSVTYRWLLTRKVGKKVFRVARGTHGYGRQQDAIRAFENLAKLFDGTMPYTKN